MTARLSRVTYGIDADKATIAATVKAGVGSRSPVVEVAVTAGLR